MNATAFVREEANTANDPIRVYLDLANRWDAASREVDGLVAQLTRAAERLRGTAWRKSTQNPIEPWPAAEDLGKKMSAWHGLKTEMSAAWELIPAEDRRQMKDPPV